MAGVNKIFVVGNLGRDPEVRATAGGVSVCHFSVAVSNKFNDKAGVRKEQTEWIKVVAWGKTAELCGQYLSKGGQVHIEGKLKTSEWTNKEGVKQYTTEVVAEQVTFLSGNGRDRGSDGDGSDQPDPPKSESGKAQIPSRNAGPQPGDDDIPF